MRNYETWIKDVAVSGDIFYPIEFDSNYTFDLKKVDERIDRSLSNIIFPAGTEIDLQDYNSSVTRAKPSYITKNNGHSYLCVSIKLNDVPMKISADIEVSEGLFGKRYGNPFRVYSLDGRDFITKTLPPLYNAFRDLLPLKATQPTISNITGTIVDTNYSAYMRDLYLPHTIDKDLAKLQHELGGVRIPDEATRCPFVSVATCEKEISWRNANILHHYNPRTTSLNYQEFSTDENLLRISDNMARDAFSHPEKYEVTRVTSHKIGMLGAMFKGWHSAEDLYRFGDKALTQAVKYYNHDLTPVREERDRQAVPRQNDRYDLAADLVRRMSTHIEEPQEDIRPQENVTTDDDFEGFDPAD